MKKVDQYKAMLGMDATLPDVTLKNLMSFLKYDIPLPESIIEWLGKLGLLYGVPFNNLVPDNSMLTNLPLTGNGTQHAPPGLLENNSMRFFYIDMDWIDSMIDGALSLATQDSADYILQKAIHASFRTDIEKAMLEYRAKLLKTETGEAKELAPSTMGTLSGILMRSPVVAQWKGLEIQAYFSENGIENNPADMLQVLRMERLAPDVMLVLFSGQFAEQPPTSNFGIPQKVIIKEPSESVYNGFEPGGQGPDTDQYSLTFRELSGSNIGQPYLNSGKTGPALYQLNNATGGDFRDYGKRVLNVKNLVGNVLKNYPGKSGTTPITPPKELSPKDMAVLFINSPRHFVFNPQGKQ